MNDRIARAKAGDETAFLELFESIKDIAVARAKRHAPNQIDDAVQEMRLRLWNALDRYDGRGDFRTWVGVLFRHVAIDVNRKEQRRTRREARYGDRTVAGRSPPEPLSRLLDDESSEALSRLIESIPSETCRTAVRLRYVERLPHREIARRLGVKPASSRVYVHRGVRHMIRTARRLNLIPL
ncbi:MAG: sigma-70 family RNA polymerase sigma factor [Candidatus Poribacteria bacterium]|nr:sigma-70 family RNA polymerase sigma factor [Candidatus Poribacteria bacterium]